MYNQLFTTEKRAKICSTPVPNTVQLYLVDRVLPTAFWDVLGTSTIQVPGTMVLYHGTTLTLASNATGRVVIIPVEYSKNCTSTGLPVEY